MGNCSKFNRGGEPLSMIEIERGKRDTERERERERARERERGSTLK